MHIYLHMYMYVLYIPLNLGRPALEINQVWFVEIGWLRFYFKEKSYEKEVHPWRLTYSLKIDGWKMIHFLLTWSLFGRTHQLIFGGYYFWGDGNDRLKRQPANVWYQTVVGGKGSVLVTFTLQQGIPRIDSTHQPKPQTSPNGR